MLDMRLITFMTLCEERNYTKTAEKLFITQPAVTQHIQWLENRYRQTLIHYQNRQVNLTPAGQVLYQYLVPLQAQIKKIEQAVRQTEQPALPLRFATTLSISEYRLASITATLSSQFPNKKISCFVENTATIVQQLRAGSLDFALVEGNFSKTDFDYFPLSQETFIGIISGAYPSQSLAALSMDDLLNFRLLTREAESGTRKIVDHLLATQNLEVDDFLQVVELASFPAIKQLVADNYGISFLYEAVVRPELAAGQLQKIPLPQLTTRHNFSFIYLKDSLFADDYLQIFNYIQPLFPATAKKD